MGKNVPEKYHEYLFAMCFFYKCYKEGIVDDNEFDEIEERTAKDFLIPKLSVYRMKLHDFKDKDKKKYQK